MKNNIIINNSKIKLWAFAALFGAGSAFGQVIIDSVDFSPYSSNIGGLVVVGVDVSYRGPANWDDITVYIEENGGWGTFEGSGHYWETEWANIRDYDTVHFEFVYLSDFDGPLTVSFSITASGDEAGVDYWDESYTFSTTSGYVGQDYSIFSADFAGDTSWSWADAFDVPMVGFVSGYSFLGDWVQMWAYNVENEYYANAWCWISPFDDEDEEGGIDAFAPFDPSVSLQSGWNYFTFWSNNEGAQVGGFWAYVP